jgi:hypothetical protein
VAADEEADTDQVAVGAEKSETILLVEDDTDVWAYMADG